jgi:hypothetical protein
MPTRKMMPRVRTMREPRRQRTPISTAPWVAIAQTSSVPRTSPRVSFRQTSLLTRFNRGLPGTAEATDTVRNTPTASYLEAVGHPQPEGFLTDALIQTIQSCIPSFLAQTTIMISKTSDQWWLTSGVLSRTLQLFQLNNHLS